MNYRNRQVYFDQAGIDRRPQFGSKSYCDEKLSSLTSFGLSERKCQGCCTILGGKLLSNIAGDGFVMLQKNGVP